MIGWLVASCTSGPTQPLVTQEGSRPPTSISPTTTAKVPPPTSPPTALSGGEDRAAERQEMVEEQIEGRGIADPLVLEAMTATPRHLFVPDDWQDYAYADHPLPIGYGQTISQPYIVALMTEALEVEPGERVMEIGTGSGYQAAVLAEMGVEVFTIEIVPELAGTAEEALNAAGYSATTRSGDGYFGWEEAAPFDGIIVTAAPDHVPQPLIEQLAPDGIMVIPVGPIGAVQTLWRFSFDDSGELIAGNLGWVSFVPFTRE